MTFGQLRQHIIAGLMATVLLTGEALGPGTPLGLGTPAAHGQGIACNAVIKDPITEKPDTVLALTRLRRNNTLVIGIPKDALSEKLLFTTYISKGIAPLFGDYVRASVINFEEQGNAIFLTQTFANLNFDEQSPLARTQASSLSNSRIVGMGRISCADEHFVYAQLSGNALRVLGFPVIARMGRVVGGIYPNAIGVNVADTAAYPDNANITVDFNFSSSRTVPGAANFSNLTVSMVHSFIRLPDDGFAKRASDPAVGYFNVVSQDLSAFAIDTTSQHITRWRLEKQDPEAAISPPVKPITFWIENTTPYALRAPIRGGILAWNEAFEAAGFKDAIEVKVQPDDAEWDAGDINYNVVRWEASPFTGGRIGYGPSVSDPRTGEILAADVVLNYTGIVQQLSTQGALTASAPGVPAPVPTPSQDDEGDPIAQLLPSLDTGWAVGADPTAVSAAASPEPIDALSAKISTARLNVRTARRSLPDLSRFGAIAASVNPRYSTLRPRSGASKILAPGARGRAPSNLIRSSAAQDDNAQPTEDPNAPADAEVPIILDSEAPLQDRMIQEVVANLAMHEIGHTLGLMHNFAGSRYRAYEDIHNAEKTRGVLSGSVMDYTPVNFAPPGTPQGDYASTRLGPYDIWAVRFGYTPGLEDKPSARASILADATEPGHQFTASSRDQQAVQYDLTDDPLAYAAEQSQLAGTMLARAGEWSAPLSDMENARVFNQILQMRAFSLATIASQLKPISFTVNQTDTASGKTRLVRNFMTEDDQRRILATFRSVFGKDENWSVPDAFTNRLGYFSTASILRDGGQQALYSAFLDEFLDPILLLSFEASNKEGRAIMSGGDFIGALITMTFGDDLGPLASPDPTRAAQQKAFLTKLSSLTRLFKAVTRDSVAFPSGDIDSLRRSLKREVSTLDRDLSRPYFWLPAKTKAYRSDLRRLLPGSYE
ncbi:MAG: zinc-dependent metalloprotease [Pseudomonadota bacterium]